MTQTSPSDSRTDRLSLAQAAMQKGQFDHAAGIASELLKADPGDGDALYLAAVAARYLNQLDVARSHIAALKDATPEHGRAYQEEGHLERAHGNDRAALVAFERATRFNPALVASWAALVHLYQNADRPEDAKHARAQHDRIKSLPPPLVAVLNHLHEGRILKAEDIARNFLQKHPKHVEGMRLLADIGSRLGVHEDAEFLLESAIAIDPDNVQLRIDYIQVLRKRQKYALSLAEAEQLLSRDPGNSLFQSLFAIESMQAGRYGVALEAFDRVLNAVPDDPGTLTSRGHALKTFGRTDEAITSYQDAVGHDPEHGDAWYALANLKTYRFSDQELTEMLAAEQSSNLTFMARVHLNFALGKALEDRARFDEAFARFETGNRMKKAQSRYTSEQMQAEFDAQKQFCTDALFDRLEGVGHSAPDPIFIVGLPRAGSTLIEQILASHSQVDGTLELPNVLALAHRLRGRNLASDRNRYPRVLGELTANDFEAFGREFIENTRIHRQGAPFFTDKMPNNFRHLGLIHLMLPKATIIDARRDPLDCCWSGFKQLFAEGQEFTYGLEEIGHYYRGYVDLMNHWERALPPGRILRVQHEDVLEDLEGQVRRILDHCSLPFEQGCVDFHQSDRAVRTASSEQVRRPINRDGQEQWRPYNHHLDPLKQALGDLVPAGAR